MTLHEFSTDIVPIIRSITSFFGVVGVWLVWRQIKLTNTWNRINTQHSLLSNLPSLELESYVWQMYEKLQKTSEGSVVSEESKQIYENIDDWVRLKTFLNKFEQLCAAVNAKAMDERYAYDVHGDKVVNAFFRFENYISFIREEREDSALYLELEKVATRWNKIAKLEQVQIQEQQRKMQTQRGTKIVVR